MEDPGTGSFYFDRYRLLPQRAALLRDGEPVTLSVAAFSVLLILVEHAGEIVTPEHFVNIWTKSAFIDVHLRLHTAIRKLQQVLGDDPVHPRFVEKVNGRGYRFVAPVTRETEPSPGDPAGEKTGVATQKTGAAGDAGEYYVLFRRYGAQLLRSPLATTLLIAGLFIGVILLPPSPPKASVSAPDPFRSTVPLTSYPGLEVDPRISPDGKWVAFAWTGPNVRDPYRIYFKRIGVETPTRVTQPANDASDRAPVWTPDGRHLLFFRRASSGSGIYETPANGGPETLLAESALGEADHEHVRFDISPDGRKLVYTNRLAGDTRRCLFILDLATRQSGQLTFPPPGAQGDSSPAFSPDGKRIAFSRDLIDVQQVFLVASGGGEAHSVGAPSRDSVEGLAWSDDGNSILVGGRELRRVSTVAANAGLTPVIGLPNPVDSPSLLKNTLVYAQRTVNANIWALELRGEIRASGPPEALIVSTRQQAAPSFSPDGSAIAFQSDRSGFWEIWRSDRIGSNAKQLTSFRGPLTGTPRWSPDGRQIAFDARPNGRSEIFVVPADGGAPRQLTEANGDNAVASWSRDGEWIYFSSTRAGIMNLWKMRASGGAARQVTQQGGIYAAESFDARYVYYSRSYMDATLWRVPVEGGLQEEQVPGAPLPAGCSHWALGRGGIYVIDTQGELVYYDLRTQQVSRILRHPGFLTDWSMAVSPDERTILWAQVDATNSDLMLSENFH